jgi:hypothetical protein
MQVRFWWVVGGGGKEGGLVGGWVGAWVGAGGKRGWDFVHVHIIRHGLPPISTF